MPWLGKKIGRFLDGRSSPTSTQEQEFEMINAGHRIKTREDVLAHDFLNYMKNNPEEVIRATGRVGGIHKIRQSELRTYWRMCVT